MGASIFGQAKSVVGLANTSYLLTITEWVDSRVGVNTSDALETGAYPIQWDFGTGEVQYGEAVTYAWPSPGVFDLRISYYELGSKILQKTTRRVRIAFDVDSLGDSSEDPYGTGGYVTTDVVKVRGADGAMRLAFLFGPFIGGDHGGDDPDFSGDVDAFYNYVTKVERLYASSVLRFPAPQPDDLVQGTYGLFKYDALYLGDSDELSEQARELKKRLEWDYDRDLDDACPFRVFNQIRESATRSTDVEITHPFRPYAAILPEGSGLRLARSEEEVAFDDLAMANVTVGQNKQILSPADREARDKQSYSLGWMRGVIWDLANITDRYFADLGIQPLSGDVPARGGMAVLNCSDLSLSVRLYSWNDDDPYTGWNLWRHVACQTHFSPDPKQVGRIEPGEMYRDSTGEPVRVLPHDKAEALVGMELPLDFKVVVTPHGYFLLDPKRQLLTPIRGTTTVKSASTGSVTNASAVRALISTRGGGAMTRPLGDDETFFLGGMVTVDGYTSRDQELQERWKGLTETSEVATDLIPEGVDAAYRLTGRTGLAGGQIGVYNLDPADPDEILCNIELGPKDYGRYETIDPGVVPFPRETTGGFKFSGEALRAGRVTKE